MNNTENETTESEVNQRLFYLMPKSIQKLNIKEEDTLFHKIVRKEIKSTPVYEDDKVYAFRDVNPQAPVHILIVPKEMQGLNMLSNAIPESIPILGYLMYAASVIAKQEGLENGYRIVINNGKDGCKQFANNYFNYNLKVNL